MVVRTEILGRVKELFLIPGLDVMTIHQVADYFEVNPSAIREIRRTKQRELSGDGVRLFAYKEFEKNSPVKITGVNTCGSQRFEFVGGVKVIISGGGVICFPQRAILRIAMFLSGSEVAVEIRNQLLNTFENATTTQRVEEIDEEAILIQGLKKSLTSGDVVGIVKDCGKIIDYKNRYIISLDEKNKELQKKVDELHMLTTQSRDYLKKQEYEQTLRQKRERMQMQKTIGEFLGEILNVT